MEAVSPAYRDVRQRNGSPRAPVRRSNGAAPAGNRKHRTQAERGQHLAAGGANANVLLALIAEQPDLTLDEIVAAIRKRRIAGQPQRGVANLRAAQYQLQKKPAVGGARARGRGQGTAALDASKFDPARLVFIDENSTNTAMVRFEAAVRAAFN